MAQATGKEREGEIMKPKNNHRWNRCIIEEDYCLSFGHGEQFFHAFDRFITECQSVKAAITGANPLGHIPAKVLDADTFPLQDKNSERHITTEKVTTHCSLNKKLASFQPDPPFPVNDFIGCVSCQPSYSLSNC